MENVVIVVEVLRPSLPSFVSLVPSLVLVSKNTPDVGSNSSGERMNQPHHVNGSVSEHRPVSSKFRRMGKNARLRLSGPVRALFSQESGRNARSSRSSQMSSPMIR